MAGKGGSETRPYGSTMTSGWSQTGPYDFDDDYWADTQVRPYDFNADHWADTQVRPYGSTMTFKPSRLCARAKAAGACSNGKRCVTRDSTSTRPVSTRRIARG